MMITCWVKNIPTKVSYYQGEGLNYWYCRRPKEEVGYKPNPKDYDSDNSVPLDPGIAFKKAHQFHKWNSNLYTSFFSTWLWICKDMNKILK